MPANVQSLLRLEIPIIVQVGQRMMSLDEVQALAPGTIIKLPKPAEKELEILVDHRLIGLGRAVKVGENFGVRVTRLGDVQKRLEELGMDEGA